MKKLLLGMIALLLVSNVYPLGNPWKYVFQHNGSLANMQDSLLKEYHAGKKIDKKTIRELRINMWVRMAQKKAPGNLTIRQYCLIDMFKAKPSHGKVIRKLVDRISGGVGDPYRTWAESYTYWNYTKMMLYPWLAKFPDDKHSKYLAKAAIEIEGGFATTAFVRDNVFWPAPFGDLWEVALDTIGQRMANKLCDVYKGATVKNIERKPIDGSGRTRYIIQGIPLGFNGHPEVGEARRDVFVDGKVSNFKYYAGYDAKYKTFKAEWYNLIWHAVSTPWIW